MHIEDFEKSILEGQESINKEAKEENIDGIVTSSCGNSQSTISDHQNKNKDKNIRDDNMKNF